MSMQNLNIVNKLLFIPYLLCCWLLLLPAESVSAAIEEYAFEQEDQEQRFKVLIAEMRCPMCLNSNLAGSDAPIAANLRAEIYDQIRAGQSDDEIMSFMKTRYGDFISYRPPLNRATFLLWFGPLLLLLAGFFAVMKMVKGSRTALSESSLSDAESKQLEELLDTADKSAEENK